MNIKIASELDLEYVKRTFTSIFRDKILNRETEDEYLEVLEDYLVGSKGLSRTYIFQDSTTSMGLCTIHEYSPFPKPEKFERKYWHLANFYLEPEFRGDRNGKKALELLLDMAKQQNVEKLITFAGGSYGEFLQNMDSRKKIIYYFLKSRNGKNYRIGKSVCKPF